MATPMARQLVAVCVLLSTVTASASSLDESSCGVDGSCPGAVGVGMMQMVRTADLRAEALAIEHDSMIAVSSTKRNAIAQSHRARSSVAYTSYLRRKVAAVHASQGPAVSELNDLIGKFIAHQSSSEDKCSAQLLEAKHQLNELHVVINDLAAEINSTQISIQVLEVQLTTKREEEEVVEA